MPKGDTCSKLSSLVSTPPKSNELIPRMMVFKMYLRLQVCRHFGYLPVIFQEVYVKFDGVKHACFNLHDQLNQKEGQCWVYPGFILSGFAKKQAVSKN